MRSFCKKNSKIYYEIAEELHKPLSKKFER